MDNELKTALNKLREDERAKGKTFYNYLRTELVCCGMFESQAEEVMKRVLSNTPIMDRWGDNPEEYPEMMFNILWPGVKEVALEYINETCPNAWFKPMFER